MRLGLGTGSTAKHFVDLVGAGCATGLDIVGVPTSEATARQARELGIPLTTLDETPELDLTVDGADEIDRTLPLIKGGGGALLREKIVAAASRRHGGHRRREQWCRRARPLSAADRDRARSALQRPDARSRPRAPGRLPRAGTCPARPNGHAFVTDGGHWLLDAQLQRILDPKTLAARLSAVPGVMEHGLFIGLAGAAIVAGPDGVRLIERP